MDTYNVLGFAAFGVVDVLLFFGIPRWFPKNVSRSWPWLAIAKLGAVATGLAGVSSSADVGLATLATIWFAGGALTSLALWLNHRSEAHRPGRGPLAEQRVSGRVIDWPSAVAFWFMFGSFLAAFGCLAVRATLSPDLETIGTSLLLTLGAACASFLAAYVGGMVYDNVANLARAR